MNPNQAQEYFKNLIAQDVKLAVPRDIAWHMAKVVMHGLTGLDSLHYCLRPLAHNLLEEAARLGYSITVTDFFRSWERQNNLYKQGRNTAGPKVTNAQGGQSYHNYGLAFDIVVNSFDNDLKRKDALANLGKIWESWGGVWGGTFGDFGHFEYHPGFTWEDIIGYFDMI